VKLHVNLRSARYVLGAAALSLLVAGCSNAGTVPSVGGANLSSQWSQAKPDFSAARGVLSSASTEAAAVPAETENSNPCLHPKFPLICVKQGHSSQLKIQVTCKRGSQKISCGKVQWSTKVSNPGLKASFKPNPGNPTTETVTASKTIKPAHYYQLLSVKCSNASCPKNQNFPIYVTP
jgi:hypothetical protein